MPKLSEMFHFSGGERDSVEYVAKRIHKEFWNLRDSSEPTTYVTPDQVTHHGVDIELSNRTVFETAFPGIEFESLAAVPVMKALNESGNVVCRTGKTGAGATPPTYFVREHWRPFSEMGPPRNPSAKVQSSEVVATATADKPKGTQRMSEFVIPQENGMFKCFTCPYTDKSFQSVLMHVNRTGNKPHSQEEIPCYFRCGQVANDPHSAATHLNKHHANQMRQRNLGTCHQCQYVDTPANVRQHAAKEHAKPRKRKAVAKPIPETEPEAPKLEETTVVSEIDLSEFATAIGQLVAEEMAKVAAHYEAKLAQVTLERDSLKRRVGLMREQFENFKKGLDVFTQE